MDSAAAERESGESGNSALMLQSSDLDLQFQHGFEGPSRI